MGACIGEQWREKFEYSDISSFDPPPLSPFPSRVINAVAIRGTHTHACTHVHAFVRGEGEGIISNDKKKEKKKKKKVQRRCKEGIDIGEGGGGDVRESDMKFHGPPA